MTATVVQENQAEPITADLPPDWPPERWARIWAASDVAAAERGLPPEPWPLPGEG